MKAAAFATLRDSFEAMWPVVEALRDRGIDVPVVSPHATASFADYRIEKGDIRSAAVDLWLAASASDAHLVAPKPVVYFERGSGQTYDMDARTYESESFSTGVIHNARLFLCPNRFVAQRRQNRHPHALAIVIGSPRLDRYEHGVHAGVERGTIAIAWKAHREPIPELHSAYRHFQHGLMSLARTLNHGGMRTVVTCHPRARATYGRATQRVGWEWWDTEDVLDRAHVLIADNTSLAYEFAALARPVIMLRSPEWRTHVHHGLRFWECIPGPETTEVDLLPELIIRSMNEDPWADLRACARDVHPVLDGRAAWRGAEAISLLL